MTERELKALRELWEEDKDTDDEDYELYGDGSDLLRWRNGY